MLYITYVKQQEWLLVICLSVKFDGILTEIDINTVAEMTDSRIDDKFINLFYDKALEVKKSLDGCESNAK